MAEGLRIALLAAPALALAACEPAPQPEPLEPPAPPGTAAQGDGGARQEPGRAPAR